MASAESHATPARAGLQVNAPEALTATVRVLRVGTRSLTQAAVAQLDTVSFDDLVPFGRVRTSRGSELALGHDANGNLARAFSPRAFPSIERFRALPLILLGGFR